MAETAHSVSSSKDPTPAPGAGRPDGAPAGSEAAAPVLDPAARLEQANAITYRNVLWAVGVGLVPFPVADVLALAGVQMKLLKELSDLYGVKFSEGVAKKVLVSLISSIGSVGIGTMLAASFTKVIPAFGTTLGVLTVPVLTGAVTHAVGRVFTLHFEAGGTLFDFDPQAMRTYFRQEFDKAKETVTHLQKEHQSASRKPA